MAVSIASHGGEGHAAPVSAYHESLLRSPVFLGMVMFIGSEVMLFSSFFTAFFFAREIHDVWPPEGEPIPKLATGINTAILIASSFTMHWALVSIRRLYPARPKRRDSPFSGVRRRRDAGSRSRIFRPCTRLSPKPQATTR